MGIVAKHFLGNDAQKQERFKEGYVDVFLIFEEIDLVDCYLCNPLSKKIGADVYWYKLEDKAVVCVKKENVDSAIAAGKQIIIKNFVSMTSEYIDKVISLVLDDYSIIALFKTDDIEGLNKWCKNIDSELIVKTNLKGEQCVLTDQPLEHVSRIKAEYKANPFPNFLNFDFFKI